MMPPQMMSLNIMAFLPPLHHAGDQDRGRDDYPGQDWIIEQRGYREGGQDAQC